MTADDAVGLLARLIGSMTGGDMIDTTMLKMGGMNLLVTTREVDVATLDVLDDLTGMLLGLLGGVGVGNVGLKDFVYQTTYTGQSELARTLCPPTTLPGFLLEDIL